MIPINSTYAPLQVLVDELRRCGLRHAVTSPGSRNAPLALTLAAAEGIEAASVIDERSAGFVALGMAKATGRPVAVTCTSGTAAANLHPAVVEAWESRVPLIVLTADRPPELREVGAGQAIDQIKLYGSAVKWFVEVGTHEPGRATAIHHRALGCRAFWTAAGGRPGPVHLNFPLREPLAPVDEQLDPADWAGRDEGRPWTELREHASAPHADDVHALAARMAETQRGAIVCGAGVTGVAELAARLAAETGWPLLAEPTSGVRCGPHDRSHVVAHYDVLLRAESFAEAQLPELVLRFGDTPTSKPLREWLSRVPQVVLDPDGVWHEPSRRAELILASAVGSHPRLPGRGRGDAQRRAGPTLARVVASGGRRGHARPGRVAGPVRAEADRRPRARAARRSSRLGELLDADPRPRGLLPQSAKRIRFLANRGANGIDGVVSSALGAALATGRPTWLVIGEIAMQHDAGGLLAARRAGAENLADHVPGQRRRLDLRLPARGRARRCRGLRGAHRHTHRRGRRRPGGPGPARGPHRPGHERPAPS